MTAVKLIFLFGGVASVALYWGLSKMREHAVLDKAKHQASSLSFWKNLFAIIGVVLTLFLILSWMFGGSGNEY